MTVTTRFAPSPTGRLHVGNLRVALVNWLFARAAGGSFLLRLDDTDAARSTAAFADAIVADLGWLGLAPDATVRQSDRADAHVRGFEALRAAGRVYPCYETADELALRRRVLAGRGLPPVYDRAALALTDADRAGLEADGRRPHWRFLLDREGLTAWDDMVRGPQAIDASAQSDPVVRRADGSFLYMLPSVIDDADLGITHVIRGEDHVTNTGLQLQMVAALGAPVPAFGHLALLTGADGKLSKRLGADAVDDLRAAGIEPAAVAALLARLGTGEPVEPVADAGALVAGFALSRFGRAPARFDPAELAAVGARTVHAMPYAAVADRLPAGLDAAAWAVLAPNLATVAEAVDWLPVIAGEIAAPPPSPEDRAYLAAAADLARGLDWGAEPWAALTTALKAATGRKGRALFLPLRLALTARDHGPDMAALLPLIGRDRAVARLGAAGANA